MKTRIKATNMGMSAAITEYVEKKLEHVKKFLEKEGEMIVDVEVGKSTRHHKSGDIFRAEITITGAGMQARAVAETDDLHASIDKVQDEIIAELKTKHNKDRSKERHVGAKVKKMIKETE